MAQILNIQVLRRVLNRSTLCSINRFSSTASADQQKPHYDVIIAGGGLVGVSLAVSLGRFCFVYVFTSDDFNTKFQFLAKNETLADKKILLLESAPSFKEPSKDKYSNRVSAINKQSVGLLKKLDAWNHIESIRCKPVMQMQVRTLVDCFLNDSNKSSSGLGRNFERDNSIQPSKLLGPSRLHRRE